MRLTSWHDVLGGHRRSRRPWLVEPTAPRTTDAHRSTSFSDLHDHALRIAQGLAAEGVRKGDRVLVVAENTPSASLTILASMMSGVVVVPVAPSAVGMIDEFGPTIERVARDCDARLLVGDAAGAVDAPLPANVRAVSFESLASGHRDVAATTSCSLDDLALIQYTSGTTSRPRGVCLTHGNILNNVHRLGEFCDVGPGDVGVTWLPLFHDMGLIGSLLFTTYWGIPLVMMTPRSFASRPDSWLWAISRFGAAFSAAPNSAYHLCSTRTPDRRLSGIDLSTWRSAFNGAETIHPTTIERFAERFGPAGFARDTMCPVYGLAENTVAASLPNRRTPPVVDWLDAGALETESRAVPFSDVEGAGRRGLVCVGKTLEGQELRVVDPDTGQVLPDRSVGEIRLRGPCTTPGYWGLPAAEQPFDSGGWLCTGDRGYVVDGDLYVAGRYKHVVKRMGRTFDCAMVENALKDVEAFRLGAVAVFEVADEVHGAERLVVLAEAAHRSKEASESTKAELSRVLRTQLAFTPDELMLVPPNTIPRTTSGKVRHTAARGVYLAERQRVCSA